MPNVDFLQKSLEMILFIYDDNKKKIKKLLTTVFVWIEPQDIRIPPKVLSYALATVSTATIECMYIYNNVLSTNVSVYNTKCM